jgi:uncharacterized repeat protein (TIGR03803 family)
MNTTTKSKKAATAALLLLLFFTFSHFLALSQGQLWGTTRKGGFTGGGVILKTNADPSNYYEVKKEWVLNTPGANPQATLLFASNGRFYGLTPSGGATGGGVLFETTTVANSYSARWHFTETYDGSNPQGGLVEASNGKIYGFTSKGGQNLNFNGALFEYDPTSMVVFPKIYLTSATGTAQKGAMVATPNGKIFGVCQAGGSVGWGVLFEYDPSTVTWTVKHNFDITTGSIPQGGLTLASSGKLYGTTSQGGTNGSGVLFEYNLSTGTFTKLYDFASATGAQPSGALIQASNGKLYGMCPAGGAQNAGVIFEFDIASSQYTLKHSFVPGDPMGTRPFGGLTQSSNGKLYGLTTRNVGNGVNLSVIIEFDPANGNIAYKLGATFLRGAGDRNYSSMISLSNTLYGVSPLGGETGSGVLFSYNPFADSYQTVLDFDYGENGAFPYAGMTLAGNGKMYGLLSTGGSGKKGLLYEFDPVTNDYLKKVDFTGSNGANPLGEMLVASNGKLYGTTSFGGAATGNKNYFSIEDGSFNLREGTGFGVLFEYDPVAGNYSKKVEFTLSTGTNPYGQLMEASDGFFYGVTNRGGANNGGTIYKFDLANNQLTKLKDLPANAGFAVNGPRSGLTEAPNGKFYGVTPYGDGVGGGGIVYEYNPATGDFTILKKFPAVYSAVPNDGNVPMGRLTVGADGMLYGLNSQGGDQSLLGGSIFQVNPTTGQVVIKKLLDASIGVFPKGSLVVDASGKMYALCNKGSFGQWGTIIQYDPVTNSVKRKVEFTPPDADSPDYSTLALYPGKMEQRIALEAFTPKAYGSGTITLPVNSSAGLPVTYTSSNPAVATVSGNVITLVSVGSTDIKGVQAGSVDYNAAPDVTKSLTVTKANQTLLFDAITDQKVSKKFLSLYAYVSSGLTPTFTSSDPDIASVSGTVLTLLKIGTVTITASQVGNGFYNAATSIDRPLTITIGDQDILFPEFGTVRVNAMPFTINASASSGLPLAFTSSNTDVATVNGNQITVLTAGTTSIKAVQGGNSNYNAAADVTRLLTITKVDQTITFLPISTKTLGDTPFSLSSFSSSTLPVVYSSSSDKVTLTSGQVTIVKAGSVAIAADQPGNNIYAAAPRVEQTFCINPAKPVVTLSGSNTEGILLTSSATMGNQWYLNGAAVTGAINATLNPTAAGVYKVQVTIDNCVSEFSNDQALVVTGDIKNTLNLSIQLYPNPASDWLTVSFGEAGTKEAVVYDMTGIRIDSQSTSDIEVKFHIAGYPAGVYLVKVNSEVGVKAMRFVKR